MKAKNIFWASALALVGVFLAFTEVKTDIKEELSPDQLHHKIVEKTRYIEVEEVAHLIISKDPTLQLIDVRDEKFFNKFSLKGAINVPLKDFLQQDNLDYLDQDVYQTILFSNGSTDADVAWLLATRLKYENVFVLKGGLNKWVEQILQPKEHSVIWDRIDDEMYQYRKGASQYFGGKATEPVVEETAAKPKKVIKRRAKKEVEGGCG